ncbi:hypothetical protein ACFS07_05040 [Undibacterium arcticum]
MLFILIAQQTDLQTAAGAVILTGIFLFLAVANIQALPAIFFRWWWWGPCYCWCPSTWRKYRAN